jgi:hypothetical protein
MSKNKVNVAIVGLGFVDWTPDLGPLAKV